MSLPLKRRKRDQETLTVAPNFLSAEYAALIKYATSHINLNRAKRLREEICQLRQDLEHTRKCGQDPLYLFPEELWLMIFENLDDMNDLANCKQSCTTLYNTIKPSPQELLFGKVLPLLLPYLSYKDDAIVTCGKVCRYWRYAVNRFASNGFTIQKLAHRALDKIKWDPEPNINFDNLRSNYRLPPEITNRELLGISPFLVSLFVDLTTPQPTWNPGYLHTIDTFGDLVWRLAFGLGTQSSYNSEVLHRWCAKALSKCHNLRVFQLCDMWQSEPVQRRILHNGMDTQVLLKSDTLESLSVLTRKSGVLVIQNELIKSLSDQLKVVIVRLWNCNIYHTLPWTNLTQLDILEDTTIYLLKSLFLMQAPNLHELSIRLDSSCSLTALFDVIKNFPKLRHLAIVLTKAFVPHLSSVPFQYVVANDITKLEITTEYLNQARDLPVLFPRLRYLAWRYGDRALKVLGALKDTDSTEEILCYKNSNPYLIQIFKNMYESNVWTLFPQLENVKLEYTSKYPFKRESRGQWPDGAGLQVEDCKTFSREKLIWETDKYEMGIQKYLGKMRDILKADLRKKLQDDRISLQTDENLGRFQCQEESFKQIFPLITAYLIAPDLMACRHVCRNWKGLIDPVYTQNRTRDFIYKFFLPMFYVELKDFIAYAIENQDKPFFAQNVEIEVRRGNQYYIIRQAERLFQTVGKHVRDLTISSIASPYISEVCQVLKTCMNCCPKLESLKLKITSLDGIGITRILQELVIWQRFPEGLKTLSVFGPDAFWNSSNWAEFLYQVQNRLRDQITILKQDQYVPYHVGDDLHYLHFSELKELTIRKFTADALSLLESHWQWTNAPNLQKLHVCVTGQDISLKELEVIAQQYPKLEFLELQFTENCRGFTENIIYSDPTKIVRVAELQIVVRKKDQVRLDFLALLPFVKTLRIVYGPHASFLSEESPWKPKVSATYLKRPLDSPMRKPENDFIQIVKYFKDENVHEHNKERIYASNIWGVLPKLQTLVVVYCPEKDVKDVKVFNKGKSGI